MADLQLFVCCALGYLVQYKEGQTDMLNYGNRLGSMCGSRTEAMQKNKNIIKFTGARNSNAMRPAIAKLLCSLSDLLQLQNGKQWNFFLEIHTNSHVFYYIPVISLFDDPAKKSSSPTPLLRTG